MIVEIAEELGLATLPDISRRLPHLQPRELDDLYERLLEALVINREGVRGLLPSSFNFFVSAAMRGDRFCIHSACRLKKLPLVERYAALYGDHLLLPVRMNGESKGNKRLSVETLLLVTASVRPLVDGGLIIPIATGFCVCRHCRKLVDDEVMSVSKIGNRTAEKHLREFEMRYFWDKKRRKHVFVLTGPSEFVDDGLAFYSFSKLPDWFKGAQYKERKVSRAELIASGTVNHLFNASAFDIITQAAMARDNGCSYLSDSEAEASFFDDPEAPTEGALSRSQFAESLMHDVPMFTELPTNSILQLRREYPEAFRAYRSALIAASTEQNKVIGTSSAIARELYRDVIEPRLDALRSLETSSKIASLKSLGISVALPSISLMFGLLDQALPHTVAEMAKLLGSAGIVKAVTDPMIDTTRKHAVLQADPYFFLLKMDKKWKAERERCG
jgi:hypothetical protein